MANLQWTAPVIAACIAGAIAWLVAVLSKEQKTSELRQAWIDGLRADLSDVIATKAVICQRAEAMQVYGKDRATIVEYLYEKDDAFIKVQASYQRVRLRLNPQEQAHQELLEALAALAELRPLESSGESLHKLIGRIVPQAQAILKTEWERVKVGEPTFKITKRVALGVIVLAVIAGGLYGASLWQGP